VITPIAQTSTGFPWPSTHPHTHQRAHKVNAQTLTLVENLWGHVLFHCGQQRGSGKGGETHPGSPADLSEQRKLIVVHHAGQPKIGDHDIRVFFGGAEEEVLWFEV
jgi:hypothetical protein